MPIIPVRKPCVSVPAGCTIDQVYQRVLTALEAYSDQQADAFAGAAVYAHSREAMLKLAKQYVDITEPPSA